MYNTIIIVFTSNIYVLTSNKPSGTFSHQHRHNRWTEALSPLPSLSGLPPRLTAIESGICETPADIPLAGVFFVRNYRGFQILVAPNPSQP